MCKFVWEDDFIDIRSLANGADSESSYQIDSGSRQLRMIANKARQSE